MSRERLLYIDVAKGISIILVVFGHIVDLTSFEVFFYSFHVPVFFMITGMIKKLQGGADGTSSMMFCSGLRRDSNH